MSARVLGGATALMLAGASALGQTTLAKWTFETSIPISAPGVGSWFTNIAAEVGTGTGSGLHAGNSVYSSPVGNGSSHSFSSSNWAVGDFYQFAVSTVGYSSVGLSWDQASSGTGPGHFSLQYSTDGTSFTSVAPNYSVLANAAPIGTWGTATAHPEYGFTYDLHTLTQLDEVSTVYFRLVDVDALTPSGGTVASGGTDRIDNFTVTATAVPEPQSLMVLAGLGLLVAGAMRRRR